MRTWLALGISAACGNNGAAILDGHPDTATIDTRADAPSFGAPVTITVMQNLVPLTGVHVIFTNADSSPVSDQFTDDNGTASQDMAAGGFVTAIDPFPLPSPVVAANNIYTIAGVKPGDNLVMSQHTPPDLGLQFILETAQVPNATYYDINSDCAQAGLSQQAIGTVYYKKGCTTSDIYIVATDTSGTILATLFHPQLAATANATIDLTAEPYVPAVSTPYTYTNIPGSLVSTTFRLFSAKTFLSNVFGATSVASGSANQTLQQPAVGDQLASVDTVFTIGTTQHEIVDWGVTDGAYNLDPTGFLLPDFATSPAFDIASQTITWTAGTTGTPPDFVVAGLQAARDDYVSWQLAAPYTGAAVAFPTLPGYRIAADDTVSFNVRTFAAPGGYDAVRPFIMARQRFGGTPYLADGTTGRVLSSNGFGTVGF